MRQRINVVYKGKDYVGEYEIEKGVLRVFYKKRTKASAVRTSDPELQARLLLIELVSGV